jgi:hypothetical protein
MVSTMKKRSLTRLEAELLAAETAWRDLRIEFGGDLLIKKLPHRIKKLKERIRNLKMK